MVPEFKKSLLLNIASHVSVRYRATYGTELLVCHRAEAAHPVVRLLAPVEREFHGSVMHIRAPFLHRRLRMLQRGLRPGRLRFTLEKYWKLVPNFTSPHRKELMQGFWEAAVEHYESEHKTERNEHNVQLLLNLLERRLGSLQGKVIADFGAGLGTSLPFTLERGAHCIGIEPSSEMAKRARAAGMTIWGRKEVEEQPEGSLDAIFSSYCLHTMSDLDLLQAIWPKLKPGGVLIGNFYQDYDAPYVTRFIATHLGARVEVLSSADAGVDDNDRWKRHGTHYLFQR